MRTVKINPSRKSGFVITEQGDIESYVVWPGGIIAFDHWWPEETYFSMVEDIQTAHILQPIN